MNINVETVVSLSWLSYFLERARAREGDTIRDIVFRLRELVENEKKQKRRTSETLKLSVGIKLGFDAFHDGLSRILSVIESDEDVMDLRIVVKRCDSTGSQARVCLISDTEENNGHAVILFGGSMTRRDWRDNAEASFSSDSQMQMNALSFTKRMAEEYGRLTLIGHSKGGNLAQYCAILCNGVDKCYAIDAPGMSSAFCVKYYDEINERCGSIVRINSSGDLVSTVGNPLSRNESFYSSRSKTLIGAHLPFHMIGENGEMERVNGRSKWAERIGCFARKKELSCPDFYELTARVVCSFSVMAQTGRQNTLVSDLRYAITSASSALGGYLQKKLKFAHRHGYQAITICTTNDDLAKAT